VYLNVGYLPGGIDVTTLEMIGEHTHYKSISTMSKDYIRLRFSKDAPITVTLSQHARYSKGQCHRLQELDISDVMQSTITYVSLLLA
jgi:hypothetical protein